MSRQQIARLGDGRLHLNDGPIDLIVAAEGRKVDVRRAEDAAIARFGGVLDELCAELPTLRAPARAQPANDRHCEESRGAALSGVVARRMARAVAPFAAERFITPMAAVAGAVAEEILGAMTQAAALTRAFVNNGGDIAFHLSPGRVFRVGLVDRTDRPQAFATAEITAAQPIRGVATSGWRGRSFSLGIADAVTVLAASASLADAAATLIADAVDLPNSLVVTRARACDLQPDNDLGERLATRDVGPLSGEETAAALAAGAEVAEQFLSRGLIAACALRLQGATRIVGNGGGTLGASVSSSWPGRSLTATAFG